MATRLLLAVLPLATVMACGGGAGDDDAAAPGRAASRPASDAVVTIKTFHFAPDPITVATGTTVTFRNEDKIRHRIVAGTREEPDPEEFQGQVDHAGDTYDLALGEAGNYTYFCELHPGAGMTGLIIVQD